MASETYVEKAFQPAAARRGTESALLPPVVVQILAPLASLRLTVVLFAATIFIILAGTFAQVDKDIWQVVDEYFRCWFAWIDVKLFFPKSFFPSINVPESIPLFGNRVLPLGFYFPGAWLIGLVMAFNLLAAHTVRFKMQASGRTLWLGLGVIAFGALATWLVIVSGSSSDGLQSTSTLSWGTLWTLFKVGLGVVWLATLYFTVTLPAEQKVQRWLLMIVDALLGAVVLWLVVRGDSVQLGDSSMRILWQLLKAGFASLILLAGCLIVFRKRAGIVLLHGGIGLLMFSEFLVGTTAIESQMVIDEGQSVSFVRDIRRVELAVIDSSDPEHDDVTVVPRNFLTGEQSKKIANEKLPFDIEVVRFVQNSALRKLKEGEESLADTAAGRTLVADPVRAGTGTDVEAAVDMTSAYVKLTGKDGKPLGTYLLSLNLAPQPVEVDSKTYDIALRFKEIHKGYAVTLLDVRKDDYIGTDTPRNYSSDIRLVDDRTKADFSYHVWMNNPLRYAGETFYQSNYARDPDTGVETTTLQVVQNTGWMIPYVSCVIVGVGMLAQFLMTLVRFLNRQFGGPVASEPVFETSAAHRPAKPASPAQTKKELRKTQAAMGNKSRAAWLVPLLAVVIFAGYVGSKARPPKAKAGEMNLYEFGQIPIAYQGRIKPIDTLARNSMMIISGRQTFDDDTDPKNVKTKEPAIRWLLDVIARPDVADKLKVFRIESFAVLQVLGLERRDGFRYAIDEFRDKIGDFENQVEKARALDPEQLTFDQRRLLEIDSHLRTYMLIVKTFTLPSLPPLPDPEDLQKNREATVESFRTFARAVELIRADQRSFAQFQPPLPVPIDPKLAEADAADPAMKGWLSDRKNWETFTGAWLNDYLRQRLFERDPNSPTLALQDIFQAYRKGDAAAFNTQVGEYLGSTLASVSPHDYRPAKTKFESYFNHFAPFYYSSVLYVVAFVITGLSWLVWNRPLGRAAFWIVVLALVVHTFAIIGRIYISGRPPVTNLYSSAVFIGWATVVLGLGLEVVYRLGIGNMLAGVAGFATLLIAHFLSDDGDTFVVLQAVLDTQFWLATHVVCITLGYATTYFAGLLGVAYVVYRSRLGLPTIAMMLLAGSIFFFGGSTHDNAKLIGAALGLGAIALGTVAALRAKGVVQFTNVESTQRVLTRMIYGILCFALFFSFVGTVLGGLWADDSWGRFWGWDPKENGALIIVLWDALVLHARWGALIKERGLALLAVAGNIAVSWSWWGVNELGVGLHSYGFTDGVLLALVLFIASQLVIIGLGLLPAAMWIKSSGPDRPSLAA